MLRQHSEIGKVCPDQEVAGEQGSASWHSATIREHQDSVNPYVFLLLSEGGEGAGGSHGHYTRDAGLNGGEFQFCLAKEEAASAVAASAAEAQVLKLQFVPSIIVGDTLLQDSSFESVKAEIDRQLQ